MSEPRTPELREFDREWPEFLNELRIVLPGVQLLFGFLLAAPFSANFPALSRIGRVAYFVCFLCTSVACAFLIAPSVYHRLHWRRDVLDKERMIRTCNRLAIVGIGLLAVAMSTAVFFVSHIMAGGYAGDAITAVSGLLFFSLWFILPLMRRARRR